MSSYSTVIMVGRVGGVPESRKTSIGKAMAVFRLAVSRREGGDRGEVTDWFSVVTFDGVAETALRFVGKGDLVLVEGRLQTRTIQDRDGKEQQRVEVVASRLRLFPSRTRDGGSQASRAPEVQPGGGHLTAEPVNLPF